MSKIDEIKNKLNVVMPELHELMEWLMFWAV